MKLILLGLFTIVGITTFAQTPLTVAVDFTATDIDGNSFNLFNKLDENKYVLIDFMFTNCGPCQSTAPKLHGAFMNYGANSASASIYFVSINRDDNNAVMHSWESTYISATGPYPLGISGTQGSESAGTQAFSYLYGIAAYPSMILIAPNRTIVEQDIWPVSTAASFDAFFQSHGLYPMPNSVSESILENLTISLYPSPSSDMININANSEKIKSIRLLDILGKVVFTQSVLGSDSTLQLSVSTLSAGIYFAEISLGNNEISVLKFIKE